MSTEINLLWIKCGEQYYEENEQELSKLELCDEVPVNYPPDLVRPTIGCRAICQRSLKLIDRTLHDMEEWQENVRLHATKLLTQMLIHCERTIGPLLIEIIPVLAAKCNDEDKLVTREALKASKILGVLIAFKNWQDHALESFVKWRNLGNLKCLTTLFTSCPQSEKWESVEKILNALIEVELYYMADPEFQEHLLYFMGVLLNGWLDQDVKEKDVEYRFYRIVMTILSFSGEEDLQAKAGELLELMLKRNGELHEDHLITILNGLDFLEDGSDESVIFLYGLIVFGGFRPVYLQELLEAINKVLYVSENSEGKVKLLSGITMGCKRWTETMPEGHTTSVQMDKFIDQCLLKSIIWKAGASNEAIRSMATVAMFALFEADKKSALEVIPAYVKYLIGLMEDPSVSTRQYSTKILTLIGPMEVEKLKQVVNGE